MIGWLSVLFTTLITKQWTTQRLVWENERMKKREREVKCGIRSHQSFLQSDSFVTHNTSWRRSVLQETNRFDVRQLNNWISNIGIVSLKLCLVTNVSLTPEKCPHSDTDWVFLTHVHAVMCYTCTQTVWWRTNVNVNKKSALVSSF